MKQTQKWKILALVALALCSACTQKSQTATLITPASQQIASLQWDEAIAATTTVKVNNSNLISMR